MGKTTLAKALQEILAEPYFLMGIDMYWFTMPESQIDLLKVDPEFYKWIEEEEDGQKWFRIIPGPLLDRLMVGRYYAVAEYLRAGFNVIADDVIWKRLWLEETIKALSGLEVLFIGVHCNDKVSAEREIKRGDRWLGWARGSARYCHRDAVYDLEIDTSFATPEELAQKIKLEMEAGIEMRAFETLKAKLLQPQS